MIFCYFTRRNGKGFLWIFFHPAKRRLRRTQRKQRMRCGRDARQNSMLIFFHTAKRRLQRKQSLPYILYLVSYILYHVSYILYLISYVLYLMSYILCLVSCVLCLTSTSYLNKIQMYRHEALYAWPLKLSFQQGQYCQD